MIPRLLIFGIILAGIFSCRQVPEKHGRKPLPDKKEMTELNRHLIQKDRERIENYIERRDLKMTESPSGLWYQVNTEGEGDFLSDNDRIRMEYNCSLIDGTLCYSSDTDGIEEIVLGRTDIPAGLVQGLKMIKNGGRAILIMPPHLAFGLKGDGKRIPARSVVVYEIKAERINNK